MDIIDQLLSLSNIMLCLAIVALVWVQRTGTEVFAKEFFKKDLKAYTVWTEFFMPIGPIVIGALLMLIPQLPVPDIFNGGAMVRMVFGIGLGMLSGFVFRLIKKNILDKMSKHDKKPDETEKSDEAEESEEKKPDKTG